MLKTLIQGTRQKINILSGFKNSLIQVQELHRKQASKLSRGVKEESYKNNIRKKDTQFIHSEPETFTIEQKKLQAQGTIEKRQCRIGKFDCSTYETTR